MIYSTYAKIKKFSTVQLYSIIEQTIYKKSVL